MRHELSRAHDGEFDIKQDAGGIADIEFLVQYWVLEAASRLPVLLEHSDNVRQLDALARHGVIDADTAAFLTDVYRKYRGVLHHASLEGDDGRVVGAGPYAADRRRIEDIWARTFG
jgi:glutamate-ammonia-ligase adenylyltransferase